MALAPALSFGAISLLVSDIDRMKEFYGEVLGLDILKDEPAKTTLGFENTAMIVLHEAELPPPSPRDAGLYHLAILFSSQGDLARVVERALTHVPELFSGSADHLVSEAFYLFDPEENGIELYFDRNPEMWQWKNGWIVMDSLFLPPEEYIRKHGHSYDGPSGMKIGHIHLKVGDIEEAKKFYVDILGFDITATWPSALFVSVNRYHHHLGMNTWESKGAGKRSETLGLKSFEIILPKRKDIELLQKRLEQGNILFENCENGIQFFDLWRNQILVKGKE